MSRIALSAGLSLIIYIVAFALILDRPLTLGALRAKIEMTLERGYQTRAPKIVILAGSNGPYSHRCETIELMAGRRCVNAGIAVGIGLDYLFTRWKPELNPGDIVYLPLEEAQYVRSRLANGLGPDAAIMLRHDPGTLWSLPRDRRLAALFSGDLRAVVMSLIEMTLVGSGFHDPRMPENEYGDHIGHTAEEAARNAEALAAATPVHPGAAHIRSGYGTSIVIAFLGWASRHGVRVIGGLPVGFADSPIPNDSVAAIAEVYSGHGAEFLILPAGSRYPRSAFFDSADHLNEAAQIRHSIMVGAALAAIAGTPAPTP